MKIVRSLFSLVPIALLASCGDTTETSASQVNLDRPIDMSFACWGGLRITDGQPATEQQPIQVTAQPLESCDTRARPHAEGEMAPVPVGQEDIGTTFIPPVTYFTFILQQTKGTVAIAQWTPKATSTFVGGDVQVIDADPLTPGKNALSVGEDPVAIITDKSGCKEVTANAGSCDLSILDIGSAVDDLPAVDLQRLDVSTASGPMRAKPAAMTVEPMRTEVGFACSATATGIAYIAYPSCHLVAAVNLADGTIAGGLRYDGLTDGLKVMTAADVATLSCPDECGGGGGSITAGDRPVTLDLERDVRTMSTRLAIGSDNDASITVVDIGADGLPVPATLLKVPLEDDTGGNLGIIALAISPEIGMGGTNGQINDTTAPGGQSQFVYAVATDNSVRVADILTINKECDTQVDPRLIHDLRNVKALACLVAGDPTTPKRRAGARGPGIRLPTGSPTNDAVPTSVEIFRADPLDGDSRPDPTPGKLIGYFAFITAATGSTYIVNIDDDNFADLIDMQNPLKTPLPLAMPHQLRDAVRGRGDLAESAGEPICETIGPDPDSQDGPAAGPRSYGTPTTTAPSNAIAVENAFGLPDIHHVKCVGSDSTRSVSELGYTAPIPTRERAFPDLRSMPLNETWTLTWEGSLSLDPASNFIDGPPIHESQIFVDENGMRIADAAHPFCSVGVEKYDYVQLRGCDPTQNGNDCPIGYECFTHPNSQISGLGACMLADEADRLANACEQYLTSIRRYTVKQATSGALQLVPRKRVLRTTPLSGCVDDNQCKMLADYAAKQLSSEQPGANTSDPDPRAYKCMADPDRPPVDSGKRCIMTCTANDDCALGTVCDAGVCMEGVLPPQACVNAPQRYELHAHDAFAVVGERSGYLHPIITDSGDRCVKDPALDANPFLLGRIPIDASKLTECDPTADPITGVLPGGGFEANPCWHDVVETELQPRYAPGTCSLANPSNELVDRTTRAIQFRNPGMTYSLIDPTYPGDAMCHGDRLGSPDLAGATDIPHVVPDYQIEFRAVSGFSPLGLTIQPVFPVKIVHGPGQSVWVIDEGDYLSTSIAQSSTRGQVFRVEASIIDTINRLQ